MLEDHIRLRYYLIADGIKSWFFWHWPPWGKYRRCPGCAGTKIVYNSYDDMECEVCNGKGKVLKDR